MRLRRLEDLSVRGHRVFTRVDFNVPLDEHGKITDDARIRAALPTVKDLRARGARVVLASHLGRPKGKVVASLSLAPIAERLGELLSCEVRLLPDCRGPQVETAIAGMGEGDCVLLENVRFHEGETKGDPRFTEELARLADRFVGDAFGTAHRAHSSVVGVAESLPPEHRAAGLLLQAEVDALGRILSSPERPLVAVLGGAKVSDKILVVDALLDRVDALVVGGGMAYTFLHAQGHRIGASKFEPESVDVARRALDKAAQRGVELLLPIDHVVADRFAEDAAPTAVDGVDVPDGTLALDIGPRTAARIAELVGRARTVVWNGPMGVFEWPAFRKGTETVARALADSAAMSVVGGGDSLAVIHLLGLEDRYGHVSTGGGAFLEMLEGKVLPGVQVLLRD